MKPRDLYESERQTKAIEHMNLKRGKGSRVIYMQEEQ